MTEVNGTGVTGGGDEDDGTVRESMGRLTRNKIFSLDELRTVTDAGYQARKNKDADWIKYTLATKTGREAYDKYFFNLTDYGQDYFEECMDVAVKDCWDDYQRLESGKNEKIDSEINGWIEAAFEEFLE